MSIKEKLEQSIVWVIVISSSIAAFAAGVGVMYYIYQGRHETTKSGIEGDERLKEKEELSAKKLLEYGQIFKPGDPFPIGFEEIKPGTRLSVLQSLFPNGTLETTFRHYTVEIASGPFDHVTYYFDYDEKINDGIVRFLVFWHRDPAASEYVIKRALSAFGSERVISKYQGKVVEWEDISGFHVEVDQKYLTIEK